MTKKASTERVTFALDHNANKMERDDFHIQHRPPLQPSQPASNPRKENDSADEKK